MSKICRLLLVVIGLSFSAGVYADSAPRWVKRGEKEIKELNANRLSDTYKFYMSHDENADDGILFLDRFAPLFSYVDSVYGVPMRRVDLDSIPAADNGRVTYTLTFNYDGVPTTVYAQRIDSFTRLEDYVDNKFRFNFYQLYAITNPGVDYPAFDDFTVTRHFDRGKATAMSIIPGLGQMYKGQNLKGWLILGGEVALAATLVASQHEYKRYKKLKFETTPDGNNGYHNNQRTWMEFRTFSAIAMGALYIYNLFDAALCNIPRRVEISRANTYNAEISFSPALMPDYVNGGFNMGLGVNFAF